MLATGLLLFGMTGTAFLAFSYRAQLVAWWQTLDFTSSSASQPPDVKAAADLADIALWFDQQPWVVALQKSMPRGVTISMNAQPFDSEGWSAVELREHHSANSGFDPDVSPMVGLFRVARNHQAIEWMDPVTGGYQPLSTFLEQRGLGVTHSPRPTTSSFEVVSGDFETQPPEIANRDPAIIVPDPARPRNHVARIIGPDELGFTLLASIPPGTSELMVKLRLLHPLESKITTFPDGTTPEGIRLRLRLINNLGNSVIRDAIVRPSGQWRNLEFVFYDLPARVVQVSVEALWMEGPIYIDDVQITSP